LSQEPMPFSLRQEMIHRPFPGSGQADQFPGPGLEAALPAENGGGLEEFAYHV
jgi:hypothetical protein